MKTEIYVYSGTGNSLWAARTLAGGCGASEDAVRLISRLPGGAVTSSAAAVGIVFPVHIWGVPRRVLAFLEALRLDPSVYCFAVAVNAGQVAATLPRLQKCLQAKGLSLACGFGLVTPSNYLPWGGPGPRERQLATLAAAGEKLKAIAAAVAARVRQPVERGPWWQNLVLTGLNRLAFPRVPAMDKGFWADDRCNQCGVCQEVCPCDNILLAEMGKPVWRHRCEQCLACIQWCPRQSIQFGRKTAGYERYHHPEIRLADLTAR